MNLTRMQTKRAGKFNRRFSAVSSCKKAQMRSYFVNKYLSYYYYLPAFKSIFSHNFMKFALALSSLSLSHTHTLKNAKFFLTLAPNLGEL